MICNLGVVGSNPTRGSEKIFENGLGRFQSGQMGQTVNLLRHRFGGSNPSLPTQQCCGSSSVDRASAFQAEGRGFEPRLPLKGKMERLCSSGVERILGKDEVAGSIPAIGSSKYTQASLL